MTFRAWFYRTDPQSIGRQFGTLLGFLRNTFRKRTSQKKPRNIFQTEKFRTIFEKRTPIYSLAAPLLGLAKSIYLYVCLKVSENIFWVIFVSKRFDAGKILFILAR